MKSPAPQNSDLEIAWFCLKTRQKHERIAAAHLRQKVGIEVFNPTLRIHRSTRRGHVWFVEALFPGYLFARFSRQEHLGAVKSSPSIQNIVAFGAVVPRIPDSALDDLRAEFDQQETREIAAQYSPGDEVQFSSGPLVGLRATVLAHLEASSRVQILIEFLGGITRIEVPSSQLSAKMEASEQLSGTNLLRRPPEFRR